MDKKETVDTTDQPTTSTRIKELLESTQKSIQVSQDEIKNIHKILSSVKNGNNHKGEKVEVTA